MIYNFSLFTFLIFASNESSRAEEVQRNKLILISFDGMRWDYLDKYGPFENFDLLRKGSLLQRKI